MQMDATLNDMTKRLKLDTKNTTYGPNLSMTTDRSVVNYVLIHLYSSCRSTRLIASLRSCLHRCNFVNQVYARMHRLRDEAYSSVNAKHEVRTVPCTCARLSIINEFAFVPASNRKCLSNCGLT